MPQFKFYQVDYISHNALVSPCLENTLKFKALGLKQPRVYVDSTQLNPASGPTMIHVVCQYLDWAVNSGKCSLQDWKLLSSVVGCRNLVCVVACMYLHVL